jgi:hypothetical protein
MNAGNTYWQNESHSTTGINIDKHAFNTMKVNTNIIHTKVNFDHGRYLSLLISDIHFDNPKCRRDILKNHWETAVERGAKIRINGDFFCIMQGKFDKRASKDQLRPEHVGPNYFDLVVDEAIEWFKPFAHHIEWISYGNHETSVMKRNEIDVLKRFVDGINSKTGSSIKLGGYGGWECFSVTQGGHSSKFNLKYMHGFGGGGPVTKGTIQHSRMQTMVNNADVIWMGHVHELYIMASVKESANFGKSLHIRHNVSWDIRTPTYKDEFIDGSHGWHIERGAPPKIIGGIWMDMGWKRIQRGGDDVVVSDFVFSPCVGYI